MGCEGGLGPLQVQGGGERSEPRSLEAAAAAWRRDMGGAPDPSTRGPGGWLRAECGCLASVLEVQERGAGGLK